MVRLRRSNCARTPGRGAATTRRCPGGSGAPTRRSARVRVARCAAVGDGVGCGGCRNAARWATAAAAARPRPGRRRRARRPRGSPERATSSARPQRARGRTRRASDAARSCASILRTRSRVTTTRMSATRPRASVTIARRTPSRRSRRAPGSARVTVRAGAPTASPPASLVQPGCDTTIAATRPPRRVSSTPPGSARRRRACARAGRGTRGGGRTAVAGARGGRRPASGGGTRAAGPRRAAWARPRAAGPRRAAWARPRAAARGSSPARWASRVGVAAGAGGRARRRATATRVVQRAPGVTVLHVTAAAARQRKGPSAPIAAAAWPAVTGSGQRPVAEQGDALAPPSGALASRRAGPWRGRSGDGHRAA